MGTRRMSIKATPSACAALFAGASLLSLSITAPTVAATDPALATSASVVVDVDKQAYDTDFFAQYTPQTALDMIKRLPGFVFDEGSSARGFGGTAGNVLIDGTRPTSKSGGLSEALSRIPATQVDHIEVRRGAIGGGEAAGQSMVANVVRLKDVSTGTWSLALRKVGSKGVIPSAEATYATQLAGWDTSFKFESFLIKENRDAVITARDADGTTTRLQTETRWERNRDASLSFDAGRKAFGGRLQINGRFGFDSWYGDTERLGRGTGTPDDPVTDRFFDDHNSETYQAELGADWSRTYAGGWKWRLIGLTTLEDWTGTDLILNEQPEGALIDTTDFRAEQKSSETIMRTTIGRNGNSRFQPEFGVEGAYNTLESSLEILRTDAEGDEIFYLPVSPVRVEEKRAEAFTNMVYKLDDQISFDGRLTAEFSRISTSGAANQAQTFKFVKPSLGVTYMVSEKLQFGLSAERQVGQLDFGDFAASADASDDRVFGGNPNLKPDRTDRLEGTIDYQFGERGALSVILFHEWKDDVLERTILPSGRQGRANVGSATRWGMEATASIPTDEFLKGGLLEVEFYARESAFLDPLTGEERRLHDFVPLQYFVDFRHDIPDTKWSWGVEYDSSYNWHGFFVNEFEDFEASSRWGAFIETTEIPDVKLALVTWSVGGRNFDRIRNLYDPTRGGAFIGTETSERSRDTGFRVQVSGQF